MMSPKKEDKVDGSLGEKFPLQILVADDSKVTQALSISLLSKLGYHADTASDGNEVLSLVARKKYDLILMDYHMPEMNGLEATQKIRAQVNIQEQPKIVALSAGKTELEKERCLDAGMDDFLTKPLKKGKLYQCLLSLKPTRKEGLERSKGNKETLLKMFEGEEDVLEAVASAFIGQYEEMINDTSSAVDRGDASLLELSAHTIKGAVRVFSAKKVEDTAFELELMGKNKNLDQAESKFEELKSQMAELREDLLPFAEKGEKSA